MPPIETSFRKQYAVLWEKTGVDRFGEPIVGEPTEIRVRWEEKTSEILGANNEPVRIDAFVVVNQDIPEGSLMWYGRLANWNPDIPNVRIMVVAASEEIPSVDNKQIRRTLKLTRHGASLPPEDE